MLKFEIPKGTKQNLFVLYLNATHRTYKVSETANAIIFTVSKPHFSQDEVLLNLFYATLVEKY